MPRKQHCYHYLYKTTNLINKKYYYGMHSTSNLDDGYLGSGLKLRRSIRKYGKENFVKEILQFFENRDDLINGEIKLITEQVIDDPLSMNLMCGGNGGLNNKNGFLNKNIAIKARLITNKILHYKLQNDLEYRERVCKSISDGVKKWLHNRGKAAWTGKKHSEETKKKMSESAKGLQVGEKNGSFGTCWITNQIENKKIKKEDLDSYLELGWVKGRKFI